MGVYIWKIKKFSQALCLGSILQGGGGDRELLKMLADLLNVKNK